MLKTLSLITILALLAGCSTYEFPGVHRITIQQGNVVTQAMIDKLKPGMTRRQVEYVLGHPVVDDQLNKDRWDYIYTISVPGFDTFQQTLQVYFIEDRLSHFSGDYAPSENKPSTEETTSEAAAETASL